MAKVIPVGQPVNEVERDAIAFLRDNLPDTYTLFHNVEIADEGRAPLEYDIILLGEHAIYAIEVKGYRGRVTGNKRDWYVQGRHRRSPLPTTFQKARILSGRLKRSGKSIGPVWVEAVVFLANRLADVHFGSEVSEHVHAFDTIVAALTEKKLLHPPHWPIKPPARYLGSIKQFLLGGRPSPGRTHVGSYRLLGEIGHTDYFRDFEAVNEALIPGDDNDSVRLRLYTLDPYAPSALSEEQINRGKWEASVLKMLGKHEGLVQAGDPFFPVDDDIGLALPFERVDGITLRSFIEEHGPLSPGDALRRFSPSIRALGFAHSRGVVHRRISPDAFLCAETGPFRLGDFAFSSVDSNDAGDMGLALSFSPEYQAPEVANGAEATSASDIYSLGVVLFQALAEKRPPIGATLEQLDSSCGELTPVVAAMLSLDPLERPRDGYDVMERLLLEEKGSASIRRTPDGECLLPSGMVVNDAYRVESRVGPPRTRTTYIVRHMISSQKRTLRLFEAGPGILSAVQEAFSRCYQLEHPCLARLNVLDEVRVPLTRGPNGKPLYFLDLEFQPGVAAEQLIEAGGIGAARALSVCNQVGSLLTYLWEHELHHGSIYGAAVLLAEDDSVSVTRPPGGLFAGILSPPSVRQFDPSLEAGPAQDAHALAALCWALAVGSVAYDGSGRPVVGNETLRKTANKNGGLVADLAEVVRCTFHGKLTAAETIMGLSALGSERSGQGGGVS